METGREDDHVDRRSAPSAVTMPFRGDPGRCGRSPAPTWFGRWRENSCPRTTPALQPSRYFGVSRWRSERSRNLAADVPPARHLAEGEQFEPLGHREAEGLLEPVDAVAQQRTGAGHGRQRVCAAGRDRVVAARQHPGRGALVELQPFDPVDDLGNDLMALAPKADDRDPFAGQVDAVVPLRGVEATPGSRPAVDVRDGRDVQRAGPGDQELVTYPGRPWCRRASGIRRRPSGRGRRAPLNRMWQARRPCLSATPLR